MKLVADSYRIGHNMLMKGIVCIDNSKQALAKNQVGKRQSKKRLCP